MILFFIIVSGWTASNKHYLAEKLADKFKWSFFSEKLLVLSFLKFIKKNYPHLKPQEGDKYLKMISLNRKNNFLFNQEEIILTDDDFLFNPNHIIDWKTIGKIYLNPDNFPNLFNLASKLLNSFDNLILISYYLIANLKKKLIILFLKTDLSQRCNLFLLRNNLKTGSIIAYSKYISEVDEYVANYSPFYLIYFNDKNLKIYQIEGNVDKNQLAEEIFKNVESKKLNIIG
ncbi:hypothetical protein [Mycoplasma sp. SG1]|uniref:hypothetical protein n=1 Tax=Mycoplasma sp. SG1 TaxID=2810348 RepID=UPI0020246622|nr:hypothetical protein [Mycoplasma sp. SG1]URM53085.1 hypothetical protein JRW51_01925 [Mycoplasma sp. SG1]